MTPKLHILTTAHGDNVVLAMYDSEKVYIRGAERSMGRKWIDGKYTAKDARSLWEEIIYEGGKVIELPMLHDLLNMIMAESEIDLSLKIAEQESKIDQLDKTLSKLQEDHHQLEKLNSEHVREIFSLNDMVSLLKHDISEIMNPAYQEASFNGFE